MHAIIRCERGPRKAFHAAPDEQVRGRSSRRQGGHDLGKYPFCVDIDVLVAGVIEVAAI